MADSVQLDPDQLPLFQQRITGTLTDYDIITPANASMQVFSEVDQVGYHAESFSDNTPHDLVNWTPRTARVIKLWVSCTARDNVNSKGADWQDIITLTTFGGTVTIIDGGLGAFNYSPYTATWNTITAVPVIVGSPNKFAVTVTGLANLVIRWKVVFRIIGTQSV